MSEDRPYHDESWLREKYLGDGLTQEEIADKCDVSQKTISRWMIRHAIGTDHPRGRGYTKQKPHATYTIHNDKYPVWRDRGGDERVFVHHVLAIAEGHDPYKVFSDAYHIHHRLGSPIPINVGWNVELLTAEEHGRRHSHPGGEPYTDPEWLRQKYIGEGLSGPQIADICGVHFKTIYRWMDSHGIERRSPGPDPL